MLKTIGRSERKLGNGSYYKLPSKVKRVINDVRFGGCKFAKIKDVNSGQLLESFLTSSLESKFDEVHIVESVPENIAFRFRGDEVGCISQSRVYHTKAKPEDSDNYTPHGDSDEDYENKGLTYNKKLLRCYVLKIRGNQNGN